MTGIDKEYFIKKTEEVLKPDDIGRVSPSGFGFDYEDYSPQKCILFIGLNPAGDADTVKNEKKNTGNIYFYSFEDFETSSYGYNKYFRPLYSLANIVTDRRAKWPWCLKKWEDIEKTIDNDSVLFAYKERIEFLYDEAKESKPYVVYSGDLFYYHDTNSKKVKEMFETNVKIKEERCSVCEEILKKHIELLHEHNKEILFIYINNASASRWLSGNDNSTYDDKTYGVPVFFGGMLSGQRAMDNFSKKRLEQEIRNVVLKTNPRSGITQPKQPKG